MSDRRFLTLLLGGALALRLGSVLLLPNQQVSDALTYDRLARQLLSAEAYILGGRPSAWWPVGYPAFLAGLYRVFGPSPIAGQLANVILSTITVGLTYWLIRRLDERAGRVAGIGAAVLPSHVAACNLLTTETLCTTLWMGAIAALWPKISVRRGALGGALLGLAALVRPTILLFLPIWFLGLWFMRRTSAVTARSILACFGAMLLILSPWTIRNWDVLGSPVLVSTNGGFNLWVGNNPRATGNYLLTEGIHSFQYAETDPEVDRDASEVAQDRAYRRRALEFMRREPTTVARLALIKFRFLWGTDNDATSWLLSGLPVAGSPRRWLYLGVHGSALLAYWTVLLAATCSFVRGLRGCTLGLGWLLLIPAGLITATHLLFFADDRFHFPAMPPLIGFGALLFSDRPARVSDQHSPA